MLEVRDPLAFQPHKVSLDEVGGQRPPPHRQQKTMAVGPTAPKLRFMSKARIESLLFSRKDNESQSLQPRFCENVLTLKFSPPGYFHQHVPSINEKWELSLLALQMTYLSL